jgi:hypothetical protein
MTILRTPYVLADRTHTIVYYCVVLLAPLSLTSASICKPRPTLTAPPWPATVYVQCSVLRPCPHRGATRGPQLYCPRLRSLLVRRELLCPSICS